MPKPPPPGALAHLREWANRRIFNVRRIQVAQEFRVPPIEDFPLRLYDVLYESGRFPAIYRVLGDLVLEAPFSSARFRGLTLRLEALVPTSEDEVPLVSEPKLRVIIAGASRKRQLGARVPRFFEALAAARTLLIGGLELSPPSERMEVLFPIPDWPDAYAAGTKASGRKLSLEGLDYEVRLSLEGVTLHGPPSEAPFRWAARLGARTGGVRES